MKEIGLFIIGLDSKVDMENSIKKLLEMNFQVIGEFFIKDSNFHIECEERFLSMDKFIYVHTIDNQIVRVGSSKGKLQNRMKSWERDVSKSLKGIKSPTPLWEGERWKELLKNNSGVLYGKQGSLVKTDVGEINTFLSEESYLISELLPIMNRSKYR